MKLGVIGISAQASREFITHSLLNEFTVVTTPQIALGIPSTKLLQVTQKAGSEMQEIINVLSHSDAVLFYADSAFYTGSQASMQKAKLIVTAMRLCNLRRLVICTGEQPKRQLSYHTSLFEKIFGLGTQNAYSIISKSNLDWTVLTHHNLTPGDVDNPTGNGKTLHTRLAKETLTHVLSSTSIQNTLLLSP